MCVCQKPLSNVLDSDHLPIFFHMMDHISTGDISAPVETHTDWEQFQSLASELIPPRIQIDTVEEGEKAAPAFIASIASANRLSTRKLTLSDLNNELSSLQVKRRLWKLWHETRDSACKTAFNWVTKTGHRTIWRNEIERWETKYK